MRKFNKVNESFMDMYVDGSRFTTIFSDYELKKKFIGSPFGNESTPCNMHAPYVKPFYIWETPHNGCVPALRDMFEDAGVEYKIVPCRDGNIDNVIAALPVSETEEETSLNDFRGVVLFTDFVNLGYEGMRAILDIMNGNSPYVISKNVHFVFHSILPIAGARDRWNAPDSFIKNFKMFDYDPRHDFGGTDADESNDAVTNDPSKFAGYIERTQPDIIYVSFKYGRHILTVDDHGANVIYTDDIGKKSAKAGGAQTIEGVWNRIDAAGDLFAKGIRYVPDADGNLVPAANESVSEVKREIKNMVRSVLNEISDETIDRAYQKGSYEGPHISSSGLDRKGKTFRYDYGDNSVATAIETLRDAFAYYMNFTHDEKYSDLPNMNAQAYKLNRYLDEIEKFFVRKYKQQINFDDANYELNKRRDMKIAEIEAKYGRDYLISASYDELKEKLTPEEYELISNFY